MVAWSCAFFIFAAATNCIALVIWAVFLTDLMRRRMSRVEGIDSDLRFRFTIAEGSSRDRGCDNECFHLHMSYFQRGLEFSEGGLEIGLDVIERLLVIDLFEERLFAGGEEFLELCLALADAVDGTSSK